MPTSTRRERPFYDGFPANACWFSFLRRRGGRPCPPAGIARFHGNPMRIRNILMGRCGHRPLQTTAKNRRILRADRICPPLQRAMMNRNVFRFSPRRGRCPHRPAGNARFMMGFRQMRVGFPFCVVGADDPVRPPELRVFTEIRCESATF